MDGLIKNAAGHDIACVISMVRSLLSIDTKVQLCHIDAKLHNYWYGSV